MLKNRNYLILIILIIFTLILFFHAKYYYPFLSDDSLISLRYADRFLDGKGLTWTDGKPVEGYSNLLWILLVSTMGFLGMDLIEATRLLGLFFMTSTMITVLMWYLLRNNYKALLFPVIIGLLFYSLSAPISVWSIGGLEQPLYAALIALSIPLTYKKLESEVIYRKDVLILSFVLGLLSITRPDGPLFTISALISIYIGRYISYKKKVNISQFILFLSFPMIFYLGQTIFRFSYYGEIFPNTAFVKISPSYYHFNEGISYIATGLYSLFPFSIIAIIFLINLLFIRTKRSIGIILFVIMLIWIPYVIFLGGDIFPAFRHFIPFIVIFTFSLIEGSHFLFADYKNFNKLSCKVLVLLSSLILFYFFAKMQFSNFDNKRALTERFEWAGMVTGLLLKNAFINEQPLIAVTAAGCFPYWSELPAIDMLGLNDYYLPRNRPKEFGEGWIGHELGDANYILKRNPDIIIFLSGTLYGRFKSDNELKASKEFNERYRPVKVQGNFPFLYRSILWFNKSSSKTGMKQNSDTIKVPAHLMETTEGSFVYPNQLGKLVVSVNLFQGASVVIDSVNSLNWDIIIKASNDSDLDYKLSLDSSKLIINFTSKSLVPSEIEEITLIKNSH